ncbi:MAG: SUMF1/EgtB/PvdO family nonheme iron enzyme, partial [Prosthecobacter sp.]|nr:SUMF1/EgtB/PvdO family nonheme iron enzyme [Prosthecobacter sp.]
KEGKLYRLPTDKEWSIAVGIDRDEAWKKETTPATVFKDPTEFPWGTKWPPPKGSGNYSDESRHAKAPGNNAPYLAGYDDAFPTTAPVMSFKPNQLGLYDMGGNVWEWMEDWGTEKQNIRVLRGASFYDSSRDWLLASFRAPRAHDYRHYTHSFRVVLETTAPAVAEAAIDKPLDPQSAQAMQNKPVVNSLGMKFVPVPITGGPTDGKRVLFSVWSTRVQDYEVFAKETQRAWMKPDFEQGPTHPVVGPNWDDAQAFCAWMTERERKTGRLAASDTYRLPSDHEWSCAAGIGTQEDAAKLPIEKHPKIADLFPWGAQWPPPKGAGNFAGEEMQPAMAAGKFTNIKGEMTGYNDGFVNTSPVGSFAANQFGLHDMGGNVWQWCADWVDATQKARVLRGSSSQDRDRVL